ncbi:TonB-dependent receptor [Undibacterium sp. Jales W-56]|uniref:TonB-dependent receptor n=1 Tax=Undibacterium sp. Jales W-56 TaxID=2897325 RepID=UPI0021D28419|nr:TonB-dependent receptor [Undibacterium sp. Jales W-56]MCU6433249.1 TonB-dependent receptor [Undibacterium sp. Jales W-56]
MATQFRLTPICLILLQAFGVSAYAQETQDDQSKIVIFGRGKTRQVQDVTKADLLQTVPGSSPLKTLDKLPGVSFQSADPFGAYEWSTRFSVRGFNQNQMGFTLDNVPLGDMSYGNNNGLHISRAISSENIGRVTLSQGAGAVGTASTSNLGGTVQFFSSNPTDETGFSAAQTIGSNSTYRTFARVDTGLFAGGTKAYLSVTRQRAEKSKGVGAQDQDQFNSKLVNIFGENKFTAFFNYSDRRETDYQDMSIEMTNRLGYDWDNYAPDWQRAVNAAKGIYTGKVNSLDDAYYSASGLRKDYLFGSTLENKLGNSTYLKTTYYHHTNEGQGHWYTPYVASTNGIPIAIRTTEYSIGRDGIIGDLTWDLNNHSINAGVWAERSLHTVTRNFYDVIDGRDTNYFLKNPTSTGFKQDFTTTTTQLYLQDTVSLMSDDLKLNFGFKTPKVTINATSLIGTRASGQIVASKTLLPQFGLNYALNKNDEIFASLSQNMRAFQPGVSGPFSQSQTAFKLSSASIKPETSTTLDLGYRFKHDSFVGSIAAYYAKFEDRLLSVATCAGIVGCPSTFVNVGKVETNGIEAAALWSLNKDWSWFNSLTYNNSKYKSNYLDNGKVVNIEGTQVVDSPKLMLKTELSYEAGNWFSRIGGKFTDKRFYSYTNDAQVPSYVLANLSAGYKQKSFAGLKDFSVQVNVENLLNKQYFSTLGSNGFPKSDPTGTEQTLLTGSPRQFFVTVSGKL